MYAQVGDDQAGQPRRKRHIPCEAQHISDGLLPARLPSGRYTGGARRWVLCTYCLCPVRCLSCHSWTGKKRIVSPCHPLRSMSARLQQREAQHTQVLQECDRRNGGLISYYMTTSKLHL